ncbi:MAG TPA: hypothetical protein VFC42_01425 [Methylomirabilota bacterium]|nr:hypothetical protein [Methylomirabilota bacterium]
MGLVALTGTLVPERRTWTDQLIVVPGARTSPGTVKELPRV